MITKHVRLSTACTKFYHAMIIKKDDDPDTYYITVFMSWDQEPNGASKYKTHVKGTSEQDVLDKLKKFIASQDKIALDLIRCYEYL